jgi:hypothetical protein
MVASPLIDITFGESFKLNFAIKECLRQINSYGSATGLGKSAGVNFVL